MFLARRTKSVEPTLAITRPVEVSAAPQPSASGDMRASLDAALQQACSVIETDIERAIADVTLQNTLAVERARSMASDAERIGSELQHVALAAGSTNEAVSTISVATREVSSAGQEIARQAAQSSARAQSAVTEVAQAGESVHALLAATENISGVLRLITDIADRINLVALNAAIEAARVGEAGRGFAVVAGEVKSLAHRTKSMATDVAQRVEGIRASVGGTQEAVARIGEAVREMNEANASVAAAVEQQDVTLRGVAESLQAVATESGTLADTIAQVSTISGTVGANATITTTAMAETAQMLDEMSCRLMVSLRNALVGGRRVGERVPVEMTARIEAEGAALDVTVLNISVGGALLRLRETEAPRLEPKGPALIDIDGIGRLPMCRVGGRGQRRLVQFDNPSASSEARLTALLDRVQQDDRRFLEAAQDGARRISTALTDAVRRGAITIGKLFDFTYTPIPGSDPQQFLAPFTGLTDELFPPVQEAMLLLDPRVQFAAAVDLNGYLPTHNAKYGQAQRPGERDWNTAHCRNRRIFNDRAGLAAGRCSGPSLLQSYERDMGSGEKLIMKEADAPIAVDGRAWGGFRLCFKASLSAT